MKAGRKPERKDGRRESGGVGKSDRHQLTCPAGKMANSRSPAEYDPRLPSFSPHFFPPAWPPGPEAISRCACSKPANSCCSRASVNDDVAGGVLAGV